MTTTGGTGAPFGPTTTGTGAHYTPLPQATIPYTVIFYERDRPSQRIGALLGENPPTPARSGGDWNVVPLPKRAAVTIWQGRSALLTMAVPIILGSSTSGPVMTEHTALIKAWTPDRDTEQPPVLKISSPGDAVPYQGLAWVIDTLDWGEMIGGPLGRRVMQKLTVNLLQFRDDEKLQTEAVKKPKPARTRTHVVKQGETLITIANKLKLKGGWRALGDAQHPPIRDPRKVRVGQKLTVPA